MGDVEEEAAAQGMGEGEGEGEGAGEGEGEELPVGEGEGEGEGRAEEGQEQGGDDPGDGGAPGKKTVAQLEQELQAIAEGKVMLQADLKQIEKQVYDLEESYLVETGPYGNVLKGWDKYLASRLPVSGQQQALSNPKGMPQQEGQTHHASLHQPLKPEERLFSLSSVTSPAAMLLNKKSEHAAVNGQASAVAPNGSAAQSINKRPPEVKSSQKKKKKGKGW